MRIRISLSLLLLIVVSSLSGFGQRITGTIQGLITDPSGAVLPGVEITVTNEVTQQTRTSISNELGLYTVPLLQPGTYAVAATLPGFKTGVQRGVLVEVDRNARVDIRLEVGNVGESVEVTADAPLIQTDTSALGQVIDTRRVAELPLNGREFLQLAVLTPGVQPNVEGSNLASQSGSVNVNGAREEFNNFLLDGVDNDDISNAQLIIVPGIDSIQEFKVQTSNYAAEYGRSAGGLVNVSTKSGTNQIHGSVYGFLRHSSMDARNFFANPALPKPPFERNQWGATLGLPIVKNRTFVFGSYERTDIRQAQSATARVPPAEWRNGDFSSLPMPLVDPLTGQAFRNNQIPVERFNRIGKAFVDRFPLPNSSSVNNLNSTSNLTSYLTNVSVRFDHQFSEDDNLFVRYSAWKNDRLEPFSRSPSNIAGYGVFLYTKNQSVAFNETHIFNPNLINEARFGFARLVGGLYAEQRNSNFARDIGITGVRVVTDPGFPQILHDVPVISASGFNILSSVGNPHVRYDDHFNYVDNVSYNVGAHRLKMGVETKRISENLYLTGPVAGQFNFENRYTGNSIADMLLGYPSLTIRELGDVANYERLWHNSFYFQDDWRATDRSSFNLDLRYELQLPNADKYDRKGSFDPIRGVQVLGGDKPIPPEIAAVMAQYPGYAIKDSNAPRAGYKTDPNNLAPRVGAAYDVAGDGKTVIRAGGGVFYIPIIGNKGHSYKRAFPFVIRNNVFSSTDPRTPNVSLSDPFPAELITAGITAAGVNPDFTNGYMIQDNLNIQREIGKSMVVEVGYAGSKGSSLPRTRNVNQARLGPGTIASRRLYPQFGNIGWLEDSAHSNYHSFQIRFDRRLVNGFSLLTSYTWSKSIDDNSGSGGLGESGSPQDNSNLRLERGPSVFDRTHRATIAYIWELPVGRNASGLVRALLGGWQTNGIYQFSTGQPFTPALTADNSLTGNTQDRPNLIGDAKLDNPSPSQWINRAAFAIPPLGTFGNAGRNGLRGDRLNNLDVAVFKSFPRGDNANFFQFRAEIFNVPNHPQFLLPNRFADSPSFGTISRARDGRDIQLALKMNF